MKNLTKLAISAILLLSLIGCEETEESYINNDGGATFDFETPQDYALSRMFNDAHEFHFREIDSGDDVVICIEESRLVETSEEQYRNGTWDMEDNVLTINSQDAEIIIDFYINVATTYHHYNIDVYDYGDTIYQNSIRTGVWELRSVWEIGECNIPLNNPSY